MFSLICFGASMPSAQAGEVSLRFATYYGENGDDWIKDVSVDEIDGETRITIAGITSASSFSFLGDAIQAGDSDAFVAQLTADGSSLLWKRVIGGPGVDGALAIDVAKDGSVVVTGFASREFPTTAAAYARVHHGKESLDVDAFVAKLGSSGDVEYLTLIGGPFEDVGEDVKVDGGGEIYVFGNTASTSFPVTPGAVQLRHAGGAFDSFVLRLNPSSPDTTGTGAVNLHGRDGRERRRRP